jgi:predicted nucleotidyltransferase component of viral defense system
MSKEIKDIAASVRTRLLNISKSQGKPFEQVMTLYMLERFLYRLSISKYRTNFILKGGLLLYVLAEEKSRPTKDIDFLARQISNEINNIAQVFSDICLITCNDGLKFDGENLITENIKEDADYQGVRIRINCHLGQAKKTLHVDIGFGDIIVPKAEEMDYPVILEMDHPDILAYSIESVIAEKFEAMVSLAQANSRMKDFYDIYTILSTREFDGRVLYEAIFETFQNRGTNLDKTPVAFNESFYLENLKQGQWRGFLRRIGRTGDLEFEKVCIRIKEFLEPLYTCLLHEEEFFGKWELESGGWTM